MSRAIAYTRINEKAVLEWVDHGSLHLRARYENLFYGSCTIEAKLRLEDDALHVRGDRLTSDDFQIKNGSSSALEALARDFVQLALRNHPDFSVSRSARSASSGSFRLSELIMLGRKWKRTIFGDAL